MDVRLESLFPPPVLHPGAVLQHEFLERFGIHQGELAQAIGVHPANLNRFVHEHRAVTLDLGRLLAMALATAPEDWLLRQLAWDLEHARPLPRIEPLPQMADGLVRSELYLRNPKMGAGCRSLREEASG